MSDLDGGGVRRLTYWADPRALTVGWTPDGEVLALSAAGQAVAPADLGVRHPGRRRHAAPAGLRAGVRRGARGRRPDRACVSCHHDPGHGLVEALPRRRRPASCGGTATAPGSSPGSPPSWTGSWLADDRRIRGRRGGSPSSPTTRAGATSTRWPPTAPACAGTPTTAPPGAPAFYARHASTDGQRVVYESAGELWILDVAGPGRAAAPAGRSGSAGRARAREPFRVDTASELTLGRPGPHRPVQHRAGPRHRAPAHPPRRPGPHAARRAGRPGPAGAPARRRTGRCGSTTSRARTRCASPRSTRGPRSAAAAAPVRRRGAGPGAGAGPGPGRLGGGAGRARRPAAGARPGRPARLRELARGADGEISDLCWSPDSAWLAYCDPVESGLSRIMMARLADDTLVAVTAPRFVDTDPAFTSDGKYLAFLSRRSFDPIYDEHAFDLTFPASWRPFLVPLAARTPSPFGASPDGRPVSAADEGPGGPAGPGARRRRPGTAEAAARRSPTEPDKKADEAATPPVVSRRRGAGRPGGADPGRRRPLQRHAGRQGLPALVPVARSPACWATAAPAPRTSRSDRCWSATT